MAASLDGRVLACRLRRCGLEPLFCVLDGHLSFLLSCRLLPISGFCPSSSSHSNILPHPTRWRRFMLRRATSWLRQRGQRSEEHTSELQSRPHLVCRLLLEKKKKKKHQNNEHQ